MRSGVSMCGVEEAWALRHWQPHGSKMPTLLLPRSAWHPELYLVGFRRLALAGSGSETQVPTLNVNMLAVIWPIFP